VPTNKQRREAAQRHLQRQLERRAELARKRRRNLGIALAALAAVVVVVAALLIAGVFSGDDDDSTAAASPVCEYVQRDAAQNPNLTEVDLPPGDVPDSGTQQVTMTTNYGDIGLTFDQENAPCAAGALVHLTEQGFFDGTACHRLTDSPGLQVLQCGDPSGTGKGGAAFEYPTAAKASDTYPRGTIAMANAGKNPLTGTSSDGSQFFLVYGDSLEGNPNYTVVGQIDQPGLDVLDAIADKGIADGAPDGAPIEPVTIESMTLAG
jgi:peptidyl-prolyl cis-trans isomerase B (cyclophilin B)